MKKVLSFLTFALMSTVAFAQWVKPVPAFEQMADDGETVQYLYNVEAGAFFVGANDWGARASISTTEGHQVKMTMQYDGGEPSGTWAIYNATKGNVNDWQAWSAEGWNNIWVDGGRGFANYWIVKSVGNKTYRISNTPLCPGVLAAFNKFNGVTDTRLYIFDDANESLYDAGGSPLWDGVCSTWAFVSPTEYEAYLQKKPIYDAAMNLKKAIDDAEAECAGIDLSADKAVYQNNSSTIEQLQAALASVNAAVLSYKATHATVENPGNFTYLVPSNDFEDGFNGWTSTTLAQNVTLATNRCNDNVYPGTTMTGHFFENWNPSNFTGKIYTQLTGLPAGVYKLQMAAFANGGSDTYVYLNDFKANENGQLSDESVVKLACGNDIPATFSVFGSIEDGETLEIGLKQTEATANWIGIDNVKLFYYGTSAEAYKLLSDDSAGLEVKLTNGDFAEGNVGEVNIATYKSDGEVSQMQPVPGWTLGIANDDARAAGVVAYGSGTTFGGSTYGVPAAGPEGTNGYALGMVGVWTGTVQYVQDVTLPAGKYTMTVPVYNTAGTTAFIKNLIGVKYGETENFATATSYPVGKWTIETINFELAEKTKVTVSLGYQGANAGSGASQHLFLDCVKIEPNVAVELGTPAFNVEAENPVFAYSQMKEMGGITLKLQESQGITANMTIQADAVLTNSSNETVAEGTFTGNSTDGVKLAFVDAEEVAYNYAVGETYTVSVSSIAVKDAAGETKASWEYDAEDPEAQPVGCTFSVDYDQVTVDALPKAYFFPGYDDESVDPVGMCMKFFTETQMYQVLVKGTENGFEIGKEYTSDDMLSKYNLMYDLNTKEIFGFTSVKIVASEGTYGVNYHFVAECEDNCKYDVTFVEDHTLTYVPGVDATDEHAGQAGYYVCDGADGKYEHCGHYFEDAYAVTEIGDDAALEAWKTTGAGFFPAKYDENAVYAQICLTNGEYLLVNTKYLQEISNTTEEEANYLQLIYREGTTSINAGKTITYPEAEVKEVKMVNSTTPPLKYYGTAIWHDVFVDNWFALADNGYNIDFPCNVYRSVIQPNKFYFDSPYNYANIANWFGATPEETKPENENWQRALIEIDCTNPQKVSMPAQNLGVCVSTRYGWFSGGSKLPSGSVLGYGTYADNTITFDARSIASSMSKYSNGTYYYVGDEGEYTFTVTITPGANPVGPFYSLEDEGTTSNKAPKKVAANRDAQKSIMNEKFEKVQVRGEKIEMSDIKDNILKSDSDNILKPGVVVLQGANF